MTRKGDFFFTYTGVQFWPLDPRPEEIVIEDIAHALSLTCRWGGQCQAFYSVAQHSVTVSEHVPDDLKLAALLHDASEAYIGDVKRPLKYWLPTFPEIERDIQTAVAAQFHLGSPMIFDSPALKLADNRALLAERRDLMHGTVCRGTVCRVEWAIDRLNIAPFAEEIVPWTMQWAEKRFLDRFRELTEI